MKIIPASHVTALSGTGLVHCAPAHGEEDYTAFRSLGLLSNATPILCHVDETGAFSPEIANVVGEKAAASLVGKNVLVKGNAAMLQLLRKEKRVVKTEETRHRYPYDWKTNEPVIVTYDISFASLFSIIFNFFLLNKRDITVVCQSGWHQGRCAQCVENSVVLPPSL